MKDAASCDNPRLGAHTFDPRVSEWANLAGAGLPSLLNPWQGRGEDNLRN